MLKKLIILVIFFVPAVNVFTQGTVFEEARTIYKRENTFGVLVHTTGWGITYRYGLYNSGFSKIIFEGDLVGKKHPKEIKTFTSLFDNANGYVYGKKNSILILRTGVGKQVTFIDKQSIRGIAISHILSIGLSMLYAKPTYVEVIDNSKIPIEYPTEKYDPNQHTQGNIIGGASFFRGFLEGTFYPGIYVKAALNFESSFLANKINAIEVGGILDVYPKEIPIMANELNRFYFFNFYVSLTFGSKKTE